MSNLVLIKRQENQDIPVTTSKLISEKTKVQHKNVIELIQTHQKRLEKFGRVTFKTETLITKGGNQESKIYELNEQQATVLVTFMKNTEIVADFKVELVKQFYEMRELLRQKQSQEWQQTRLNNKSQNALFAQTIKSFQDYAKQQGSNNSERYFKHFQNLANTSLDIENGLRNYTDMNVLSAQTVVFNIIKTTLNEEMAKGTYYKTVYKIAKERLEMFTPYFKPQLARISEG